MSRLSAVNALVCLFPNLDRNQTEMPSSVDISLREGFCLPVIEAGAFAKPTIATAVGSLPELISQEVSGLLLKDLEPLTIANAMEAIIKDEGLRNFLGQNAKRNSEAYAMENIATKLVQAIHNH